MERVKFKLSEEYLHGTHHHPKIRSKRGLFNFIGQAGRFLFGTATSADVAKTRELIRKVSNNQEVVHHLVQDLASVVNQSRVYINENRRKINSLVEFTKNLLKALKRLAGGLQEQVNQNTHKHNAERLVEDAELVARVFTELVEEYHRQRSALESGTLTEDLLSVNVLKDIMAHARTSQRLIIQNLEWYYQYVSVRPMWGNDKMIVFQMELPLVGSNRYVHYTLVPYPVPQSDDTVVTFKVAPNIAAVMNNGTTEVMIPRLCRGVRPLVCGQSPLRSGVALQCERGILNNNKSDRQACILSVKKSLRLDEIWFTSANQVVLSTWGDVITKECKGRPVLQGELVQGVYTLHLEEACVYRGATWRIRHAPTYTQHVRLKNKPLPEIPPIEIPVFINTTVWNLKGVQQLGQVREFALKTLDTFEKVTVPLIKEGWFLALLVTTAIVLAIVVAVLIYFRHHIYSCIHKHIPPPTVVEEPQPMDSTEGSAPTLSSPVAAPALSVASPDDTERNLKFLCALHPAEGAGTV